MSILERTTRFGWFPALKIGNLRFVWGFRKWHLGFYRPKGVQMAGGIYDLMALNLGKFMIMLERPSSGVSVVPSPVFGQTQEFMGK
jgi:hypothetical protein